VVIAFPHKIRDLQLVRASNEMLWGAIVGEHYLHQWPHELSCPFGYRLEVNGVKFWGGLPLGVILFKRLEHTKQHGLFGYKGLPTAWQVLDLARVWVNPCLQGKLANGHSPAIFSRMVALSLKSVQRDWLEHHPPRFLDQPYHIELIMSYCDRQRHEGVAYRVSGFEKVGITSHGDKDIYVKRLHKPEWAYQPTQMSLF
jgi:hypothetical protein